MDAVQDVLDRRDVLAAAERFFARNFADAEALANYLRRRDAHSQFYPWLLWDAELRGGKLGRKILRKRLELGRDDAELLVALEGSSPDAYQIVAAGAGDTLLERIADGLQFSVTEPVLDAVATVGDILIGRVLALQVCNLLDAVHIVLPSDARLALLRAGRKAARLPREQRLPTLMTASFRALARLDRPMPPLCAPEGGPVIRATIAFDVAPGQELALTLERLCRDDVLAREPNGDYRVVGAALGALGARLYTRRGRLHAATRSVARAERLRVSLPALLPQLSPRLTVVCDLSALHADESLDFDESPSVAAMTRDWVDEYLHDLGDRPLAALGGATPRQAVKSPAGRTRVKALLRALEPLTEIAGPDCRLSLDHFWRSLAQDDAILMPTSR
jgi:hypothetical protein